MIHVEIGFWFSWKLMLQCIFESNKRFSFKNLVLSICRYEISIVFLVIWTSDVLSRSKHPSFIKINFYSVKQNNKKKWTIKYLQSPKQKLKISHNNNYYANVALLATKSRVGFSLLVNRAYLGWWILKLFPNWIYEY